MLNNYVPLGIVHLEIKVCDGDLHPPVILVIELNVPVNSDRAHMARTLDQGGIAILASRP